MWSNEQLDNATYTVYIDTESQQPHNVGTIEIQGSAYQGPYLITPVPPAGSLKNGDGFISPGLQVHVPMNKRTVQFAPRDIPAPFNGEIVLHRLPNGDV